jgi:hypothetical protein
MGESVPECVYLSTLACSCIYTQGLTTDTAISKTPKKDAAQLVNKMYHLLGNKDDYMIGYVPSSEGIMNDNDLHKCK